MSRASRINPPIAPRIPSKLPVWEGTVEDDLEIDGVHVVDVDFADVTRMTISISRILRSSLTGLGLDRFEMSDGVGERVEGAALRTYKPRFLRVCMTDCRFTGAEFAEGNFEDCVFRNVKFDEVGFRFAVLKRVRFENCVLRQADFTKTTLTDVVFEDCILDEAIFTSAICKAVDVSTENLTHVHGLLGLKGASISAEQLIQLAPLFASELGFHVKE